MAEFYFDENHTAIVTYNERTGGRITVLYVPVSNAGYNLNAKRAKTFGKLVARILTDHFEEYKSKE